MTSKTKLFYQTTPLISFGINNSEKQENKMQKLIEIQHKNFDYNDANKKELHTVGKKALRALAKELNLEKGTYEVRSCLGGIAVAGEIILHTEKFYLQIHSQTFGSGLRVLYRTCKGTKDYCGGPNQYVELDDFFTKNFINKLRNMQEKETA